MARTARDKEKAKAKPDVPSVKGKGVTKKTATSKPAKTKEDSESKGAENSKFTALKEYNMRKDPPKTSKAEALSSPPRAVRSRDTQANANSKVVSSSRNASPGSDKRSPSAGSDKKSPSAATKSSSVALAKKPVVTKKTAPSPDPPKKPVKPSAKAAASSDSNPGKASPKADGSSDSAKTAAKSSAEAKGSKVKLKAKAKKVPPPLVERAPRIRREAMLNASAMMNVMFENNLPKTPVLKSPRPKKTIPSAKVSEKTKVQNNGTVKSTSGPSSDGKISSDAQKRSATQSTEQKSKPAEKKVTFKPSGKKTPDQSAIKRRGRPPGSKNRKSEETKETAGTISEKTGQTMEVTKKKVGKPPKLKLSDDGSPTVSKNDSNAADSSQTKAARKESSGSKGQQAGSSSTKSKLDPEKAALLESPTRRVASLNAQAFMAIWQENVDRGMVTISTEPNHIAPGPPGSAKLPTTQLASAPIKGKKDGQSSAKPPVVKPKDVPATLPKKRRLDADPSNPNTPSKKIKPDVSSAKNTVPPPLISQPAVTIAPCTAVPNLQSATSPDLSPKKRGRPKGSKNRPKVGEDGKELKSPAKKGKGPTVAAGSGALASDTDVPAGATSAGAQDGTQPGTGPAQPQHNAQPQAAAGNVLPGTPSSLPLSMANLNLGRPVAPATLKGGATTAVRQQTPVVFPYNTPFPWVPLSTGGGSASTASVASGGAPGAPQSAIQRLHPGVPGVTYTLPPGMAIVRPGQPLPHIPPGGPHPLVAGPPKGNSGKSRQVTPPPPQGQRAASPHPPSSASQERGGGNPHSSSGTQKPSSDLRPPGAAQAPGQPPRMPWPSTGSPAPPQSATPSTTTGGELIQPSPPMPAYFPSYQQWPPGFPQRLPVYAAAPIPNSQQQGQQGSGSQPTAHHPPAARFPYIIQQQPGPRGSQPQAILRPPQGYVLMTGAPICSTQATPARAPVQQQPTGPQKNPQQPSVATRGRASRGGRTRGSGSRGRGRPPNPPPAEGEERKRKGSQAAGNAEGGQKKRRKASLTREEKLIPLVEQQKLVKNAYWQWHGQPEMKPVPGVEGGKRQMRACYAAMRNTKSGDWVRVRDTVLVCSGPLKSDLPYIAKVAALWEDQQPASGPSESPAPPPVMMMSLLWYYRPEHASQDCRDEAAQHEVFASRHWDETSVACIEDKCFVLSKKAFYRYKSEQKRQAAGRCRRPQLVPVNPQVSGPRLPPALISVHPDNIFLCRRVYDFKTRRLTKPHPKPVFGPRRLNPTLAGGLIREEGRPRPEDKEEEDDDDEEEEELKNLVIVEENEEGSVD